MGKLDYDHGFVYIAKGATYVFNLHSTAKLTDDTKSRYSSQHELHVTLEPVSAAVPNGLFGLSTETITLEQRLKVTAHKEQNGDESAALVEWFYSSKEPKSGQLPCQIHQIRFIVLTRYEEDTVEDGDLRLRLRGALLIPESLGRAGSAGNPEQVFYGLAFKLIDPSGGMLHDFSHELSQSRGGRIDWSKIQALGGLGHSSQQSPLSYFEANKRIFQKIRDLFLSGEITYTHINDMLHRVDNVIMKREEEFEQFRTHPAFDRKSHRYVIKFWKDNRKLLVTLLHYIDVQAEIRKNETGIIRDDLAIGITDADFVNQPSFQHQAEDLIARLIIPTFIIIIVWYFWSR